MNTILLHLENKPANRRAWIREVLEHSNALGLRLAGMSKIRERASKPDRDDYWTSIQCIADKIWIEISVTEAAAAHGCLFDLNEGFGQ